MPNWKIRKVGGKTQKFDDYVAKRESKSENVEGALADTLSLGVSQYNAHNKYNKVNSFVYSELEIREINEDLYHICFRGSEYQLTRN